METSARPSVVGDAPARGTAETAARPATRTHPRALFLVPGGLALLGGIAAAFGLLGLPLAGVPQRWEEVHGPLMVLAFVGTVIALERAVALRAAAAFLAPGLLGLGGLLLLAPVEPRLARAVLLAGTLALVAVYARLWRRAAALPLLVEIVGTVCAAAAAALWLLGVAVPFLAPALVGFLVLTILGERLELAAVGFRAPDPGPTAPEALVAAGAGAYLLAAAAALVVPEAGYRALGLVLAGLVAVVAHHDVARRTVRTRGLTRYMACAMLAGYAWLAVAAAVWVVAGPAWQGRAYDAALHAVFLGFVLSMIMAHAPVILPAVLRRPLPYRRVLYLPLALLHGSLLVRLLAGDAWDLPLAVQVGGVGNVVAVLLFVVLAAGSVTLPRARRDPPAARAVRPSPPPTSDIDGAAS
ncbi:hypothetical protein [Salana multivorans]|uniref:hypothetical protein n=1 Tax=Salana multivorans TaxID=120377 RepID=UPI000AC822F7|nr:hypothetical protein [Salana multivorans]